MKAGKRIVRGNTNPRGGLNNDNAVKAILQYRNTPLQDCGLSPAQILFHRHLRDSIPCHPSQYKLHSEWVDAAEDRELKYHQRNHILAEEYNRHTRSLKPLSEGTHVLIQGKDKRWNRQGEVVECLNNRQYRIRLLGSGRVTLRNRRFIKPCHKPSQLYNSTPQKIYTIQQILSYHKKTPPSTSPTLAMMEQLITSLAKTLVLETLAGK